MKKLDIFDQERPIGIQLFGGSEDAMEEAARIAEAVRPGPDRHQLRLPRTQGGEQGRRCLLVAGRGQDGAPHREGGEGREAACDGEDALGWNDKTKNIMEVAERLQDVGIQALSIHGRTRAQLYKGPADWTLIGEVKNNPRIYIPIFGNGDIDTGEGRGIPRALRRGWRDDRPCQHRASVHLQRDQALHGHRNTLGAANGGRSRGSGA
jgi:tRNA-dihydrouridine synthase B